MNETVFIAYAAALALAVATPGPATLAVVSSGIARGPRKAATMALGITVGDMVLGAIALIGLAAVATAFGWALTIIKFAGAAYLVWLGIRYWCSSMRADDDFDARDRSHYASFAAGTAIAIGNPKAILFHASLMPLIIDVGKIRAGEAAAVLVIILAINATIMCAYAVTAGGAARWFRQPVRRRWMERFAGTAAIATGAAIAYR